MVLKASLKGRCHIQQRLHKSLFQVESHQHSSIRLEASVQETAPSAMVFGLDVVTACMHDDDIAELGALRAVHGHDNRQPFFDEALTNRLHAHAVFSQPARSLTRITSDKHRDLFGL
jgi:hypothetical protein